MKTADEILHEHGIAPPPPGKQRYYTTCPQCSANRSRAHQKAACLGVTVKGDGVTWGCNHCLWTGGGFYNGKINGPGGEPARTYDYLDEQGDLLFQKVRNPPRNAQRFWQRRPDSKSGWINNTQGVRKVLYRLPEVSEAIASERTIFVVEGEKDADSLWRIGIPATCSPDGASDIGKTAKWRMAYSESLGGADIVVIPDHDDAGYAHADAAAKASLGTAQRVRMFTLAKHWPDCPKGGDISDWLAAGHTGEELAKLIEAAPDYVPDLRRREEAKPGRSRSRPLDDDAELERLAKMSVLDYDHARKAAAKRLDVRASILDKLMQAKRAELGLDADDGKQGHAIEFPDARAVAEPVNGAELLDEICQGNRLARHHARAQPRRLRAVGRSYLSDRLHDDFAAAGVLVADQRLRKNHRTRRDGPACSAAAGRRQCFAERHFPRRRGVSPHPADRRGRLLLEGQRGAARRAQLRPSARRRGAADRCRGR